VLQLWLRAVHSDDLGETSPVQPERLRSAAGLAVRALKVLSNADRLLLLFELSQGEMCVSELEKTLDIRQPMLSQKLAALRADGVVKTRREGNRIFYSVVDPKVMHLLKVLYNVYFLKE